jgi:hypothetical protein
LKESNLEKKSKQTIVEWNKLYPVETPVIICNHWGKPTKTTTRSIAFLSDAGSPIVMCHGSAKAFPLYQVKPVKIEQPG